MELQTRAVSREVGFCFQRLARATMMETGVMNVTPLGDIYTQGTVARLYNQRDPCGSFRSL